MAGAGAIVLYLLLLGPFWALDGRHDLVSDPVRKIVWMPAYLVHRVPLLGAVFDDYLNLWWIDPNQGETMR